MIAQMSLVSLGVKEASLPGVEDAPLSSMMGLIFVGYVVRKGFLWV